MAISKGGGYSGSKGANSYNTKQGAPKSFRAKHSPPNPFRPGLATPTKTAGGGDYRTRAQNPQVLRNSTQGKQLIPINSGKAEFRNSDKNGFSAIARKVRESKPKKSVQMVM